MGGGGGVGLGGQGGSEQRSEWRSEAFVKIQKKKKFFLGGGGCRVSGGGGSGWRVRVDRNREVKLL